MSKTNGKKLLQQLSCSFIKHGCSMHLHYACITTCTYCTRSADTTLCHTEKNTLWLACPARCIKRQRNSHVKCSLSVKYYHFIRAESISELHSNISFGISASLHQLVQTLPFERETKFV